jgi:hypothetical protein
MVPRLNSAGQSISFKPGPIENVRGVIVQGVLYEWGGYSCSSGRVMASGGSRCFLGGMQLLDLASMAWREIAPPPKTDPSFALWPSPRAANSLTTIKHPTDTSPDRPDLIIVFGGAFQDVAGVRVCAVARG